MLLGDPARLMGRAVHRRPVPPRTPPELLQEHESELRERFDVRSLAVFGSAARDELSPESDVDVLVEFEGPTTFDRFMDLKFFLEDVLDRPVDLVTENALRSELLGTIQQEGVRVA